MSERSPTRRIRTMGGLVDNRRSRTPSGALMELSMLEMERQRLKAELKRMEARTAAINQRIGEIDAKAVRLHAFVEKPSPETLASVHRNSVRSAVASALDPAKVTADHVQAPELARAVAPAAPLTAAGDPLPVRTLLPRGKMRNIRAPG